MTHRVRTAVFPVGGLGTRFLPATKSMPKEMLPVVDKPLIQYAVEEARSAGIEYFIFVTSHGRAVIEDHFDHAGDLYALLATRGKEAELSELRRWQPAPGQVAYTRQPEPLGLGHAVWCARDLVGHEPFAVLLADDMVLADRPCLAQMVEAYAAVGGCMVAVEDVPREQTSRYGVLKPGAQRDRLIEVRDLVEKPRPADAPSTLAIIGRYILVPELFEELSRMEQGTGGEIQITDSLARLIGRVPFNGFRFAGERFDCGDKGGFLRANIAYALRRPELRGGLTAYLRTLSIDS